MICWQLFSIIPMMIINSTSAHDALFLHRGIIFTCAENLKADFESREEIRVATFFRNTPVDWRDVTLYKSTYVRVKQI